MSTTWRQFQKSGKLHEPNEGKKLGLLVVDDESEIVESLGEMFRPHFNIYRSTSAEEAVALFRDHSPAIVITDQRMPDMTGLQLLRVVKDLSPSAVGILVTGYSDINVVVDALNEGLVWKYVTKPWDHGALRALVLRAAREYTKRQDLDERQFAFAGFIGL